MSTGPSLSVFGALGLSMGLVSIATRLTRNLLTSSSAWTCHRWLRHAVQGLAVDQLGRPYCGCLRFRAPLQHKGDLFSYTIAGKSSGAQEAGGRRPLLFPL